MDFLHKATILMSVEEVNQAMRDFVEGNSDYVVNKDSTTIEFDKCGSATVFVEWKD